MTRARESFIQVVVRPNCPRCDSVQQFINNSIKPKFPELNIEYVDYASVKGQKICEYFKKQDLPIVVVNGALFCSGACDHERIFGIIQTLALKKKDYDES